MLERLTVTKISKKVGQSQSTGKEWTKFGVQFQGKGEKWFGIFASQFNTQKLENLKAGDMIDVVTFQDKTGEFWNFRFASGTDKLDARVTAIEKYLGLSADEPQVKSDEDDFGF